MPLDHATMQGMWRSGGGPCLPAEVLIDAMPLKDPRGTLISPSSTATASSASIAAASIIAKVTRDRVMMEYDEAYPNHGFAVHKGIRRRQVDAIRRGPCPHPSA